MKLAEGRFLADENTDAEVIAFLRARGHDVLSIQEAGLVGAPDEDILALAVRQQRAVLTHDRDYGELVVAHRLSTAGIVLVRPGHVDFQFTIQTLRSVCEANPELPERFVLVVERHRDEVVFRIRDVRD